MAFVLSLFVHAGVIWALFFLPSLLAPAAPPPSPVIAVSLVYEATESAEEASAEDVAADELEEEAGKEDKAAQTQNLLESEAELSSEEETPPALESDTAPPAVLETQAQTPQAADKQDLPSAPKDVAVLVPEKENVAAETEAEKEEPPAREAPEVAAAVIAPSKKAAPPIDFTRLSALIDKAKKDEAAPAPVQSRSRGSADALAQDVQKLKKAMIRCWTPPVGAPDPEKLVVVLRLRFDMRGRLLGNPSVVNDPQIRASRDPFWRTARQQALSAVLACQPYDFLSASTRQEELILHFDPARMQGF